MTIPNLPPEVAELIRKLQNDVEELKRRRIPPFPEIPGGGINGDYLAADFSDTISGTGTFSPGWVESASSGSSISESGGTISISEAGIYLADAYVQASFSSPPIAHWTFNLVLSGEFTSDDLEVDTADAVLRACSLAVVNPAASAGTVDVEFDLHGDDASAVSRVRIVRLA